MSWQLLTAVTGLQSNILLSRLSKIASSIMLRDLHILLMQQLMLGR